MKKQVLFILGLFIFMVFASLKPTEVNPFRVYPYLQVYGKGKMQLTWFSNSMTASSIKLISATGAVMYEGQVSAESVPDIYYTSAEKNQVITGLEQGSWIESDEVFRYRFPIDLPADVEVNYIVTLAGINYSGAFTMPSSRSSWEKIRFIALADSETDPKGRVTNRAWYPGTPLFRPITTVPELWKQKFGSTVEQGIELPNYMLTEEKGYNENLKIINSRNPDFIIMPGDLVQGAGYQPGWDEFFRQNAGLLGTGLSRYAIIPALGNWEAFGAVNGGYGTNEKGAFLPVLGRNRFHTYFQTPTEDPLQKHKQSYYRVDYGPVTILTLDSSNGTPDQTPADFEGQTKLTGKQFTVPGTDTQENYTESEYKAAGGKDLSSFGPGSDQYIWLEENLKDASEDGQLIFVQYHHAAYSSGEHGVPMNHELSVGQVGTPMRILNPLLEEYGVVAVFSGHDELFERSYVDEDGDGKGIMYYDVGVAGDGLRGEKRDWLGNPLNTLNYNPYRKWSADQSSAEQWNTSGKNPVLTDGGKHYGHLEVNLEKKIEGDQEYALINFIPVYAFPVLDQNYNLTKVERRVYKDEVSMKIPLRKNAAVPVFKEEITVYLDKKGEVFPWTSDYFISGYSADYQYNFSRDPNYTCVDLGIQEMKITVLEDEKPLSEGVVKVMVVDSIAPEVQTKFFASVLDIVTHQKFELKSEDFIQSLSDNCGEDLDIQMIPQTLGCGDFGTIFPIEVHLRIKDKSGNATDAVTYVTVDSFESKKISVNGSSHGVKGESVKLSLGSEFDFSVEAWYKGDVAISGSVGKELTITESGIYKAKLRPVNGCVVFSNAFEVSFEEAAKIPAVKEKVELDLDKDGKAHLKPEQVFTNWPISSQFNVTLSKSEFGCGDLWSNMVVVKVSDSTGVLAEKEIEVIVRDRSNPVLVTKNIEVNVDLAIGQVELKADDFIASLKDNCGIKEMSLSRQSVGCDDIGKEVTVEVRAIDNAGNVVEKLAKVMVKSSNSKPVTINGPSSICAGTEQTLTLKSEAAFEVVRWRRNGVELPNQTSKTLEIDEGGSYHAIVRYAGGCLFETEKFVMETIAKPSGEIEEDGNILRAPEGDFSYQWFKDGEKISGAISRTLEVNAMGEYTVELTNESGCTTRLEAVTMTISGIFNPGILVSEELKISPNPASAIVEVQALGDLEFAENSMRIYNTDGKEVSSSVEVVRQSPSAVTLSIARLSAGTYVILVESTDSRVFVGKLIKL